ncbi:hypothetical protein LTR37_020114 [Vermiconidia calcicola]|uniref:Uncharacterized protein n=1 Tax=Vermiconidia calcicola TaxID=1690605 RepID=A0ACC3MC80_9PEZI|nr:hypothetical protein LTR37_020114 [Vermiconidia calcicola]
MTGMRTLFAELHETDAKHRDGTTFRKGIRALSPTVKFLNRIIDIANPISSFEPAAASGLAVVKSVATVAVAICGAEEELEESIKDLLNHIPLIDRCDEIEETSTNALHAVHEVLITVYSDLLDFYFAALKILRSRNFVGTLAMSTMKGCLSDAVLSFTKNADILSKHISVETSALAQAIQVSQLDDLVDRLLKVKGLENYDATRQRADDACGWILSDTNFVKWTEAGSGTNWISLLGPMGFGKTVTLGYIVDSLRTAFAPSQPVAPVVCSYYCRNDNETSNIRNIYCGMLWQLLNRIPRLKWRFKDWYDKSKSEIGIDPTQDADRLGGFLFDMVSSIEQSVHFIVDGLDECEPSARRDLLTLLSSQCDQHLHIKVLISHRPDDDIKYQTLKSSATIRVHQSRARDEMIVQHWVDRSLHYLEKSVQQYVVATLSEKSSGSATWVSLVVEYLRCKHVKRLDRMKAELKGMPLPHRLEDLYFKLFERAVQDELDNRRTLAQVLQILSISLRPLTMSELAQAVLSASEDSECILTATQLQRSVDVDMIFQLSKAFITMTEEDCVDSAVVRLVHQSLKEVILKTPPTQWGQTQVSKTTRSNGIEGFEDHNADALMARASIRYLLLDRSYVERRMSPSALPDAGSVLSSPTSVSPKSPSPPRSLLETEGTISVESPTVGTFFAQVENDNAGFTVLPTDTQEFYDYAVRFWATHFSSSPPPTGSPLHDLALQLYRKMSPPDWEDHLRISEKLPEGYPVKPGPLTVSCFYGHLNVAAQILTTTEVQNKETGCAMYWAASRGHAQCVELLMPRIRSTPSLCYQIGRSPLIAAAANGHAVGLELLLTTGCFATNESDAVGRTALSHAIEGAHSSVTAQLLAWEPKDQTNVNLTDRRGWSPLFWAEGSNASDVVSKLLKDSRVDPQLLDVKLRNPLSWACEYGVAGVVKVLVADGRVDLHNQDITGTTPLMYAVKSKDFGTVSALFDRCAAKAESDVASLMVACRDRDGRNSISWAASNPDRRILELLLRHAPQEACTADSNGWGPLAWTLDPPGYLCQASMLLPYYQKHLGDKDYSGSRILHHAISWRQFGIARLIAEHLDVDINLRSGTGRTALSLAASAGSLELVKILVEKKAADASIADHKGIWPLEHARQSGNVSIATYLERTVEAMAAAERPT